jgi:hypothetical protein
VTISDQIRAALVADPSLKQVDLAGRLGVSRQLVAAIRKELDLPRLRRPIAVPCQRCGKRNALSGSAFCYTCHCTAESRGVDPALLAPPGELKDLRCRICGAPRSQLLSAIPYRLCTEHFQERNRERQAAWRAKKK